MFHATGVKPRIVARVFRRPTMAMLARFGVGVTLVPGAFAALLKTLGAAGPPTLEPEWRAREDSNSQPPDP